MATDTPRDEPDGADESYEIRREDVMKPGPNGGPQPRLEEAAAKANRPDGSQRRTVRTTAAFTVGQVVRALDRDNYGTVTCVRDDEVDVHFISETGFAATVPFAPDMLVPQGEQVSTKTFTIMTLAEVLRLPPPNWLIDKVLRCGELAEIYGQPSSGKTFLALDFALSVATGRAWSDRAVRQGLVIYVAAEGVSGLGRRVEAWAGTIGDPSVEPWTNFRVIGDAVQFFEGELQALLDAIEALGEPAALIVIDTLSRCIAGADENSAKDMGVLVRRCDELRKLTGAAVLLVHHAAKPGKGNPSMERGSSAIRGAADTMIEVERDVEAGATEGTIRCKKQKEAEPFAPLKFDLVIVTVATLPGEPPVTSCRLRLLETGVSHGAARCDLAEPSLLICRALRDAFDADGASNSRLKKASGVPESTFDRHLQELVRQGYFRTEGSKRSKRYLLTDKFTEPRPPSPPITLTGANGGDPTSSTYTPPLKGGEGEGEGDSSSPPGRPFAEGEFRDSEAPPTATPEGGNP